MTTTVKINEPTNEIHQPKQNENYNENQRDKMADYWKTHSKRLNIQEMMLDDNAELISEEESNEIISMLPDIKDKRVVELGAGIGRFTGRLADVAAHVLAVDFMDPFITKNKETHSKYDNIEFKCADVTKLDLPPQSVDIVFSNWLFMYISDEETLKVFKRIQNWLKDDGYFFFRESCFHQSGNKLRDENPTLYRDPTTYAQIINSSTSQVLDDNKKKVFNICFARPVQTYIRHKQNSNQLCWLLQSKTTKDNNTETNHEHSDSGHFPIAHAQMLDRLLSDDDIINIGMEENERKFYDQLKLKGEEFIIDAGCGNGKYTFLLAKQYNTRVLGMDLSTNQVSLAMKRSNRIKDGRVFFEICDLHSLPYSSEIADVIHLRDTIHHLEDKQKVLTSLYQILKPKGQIMVGEYTLTDKSDIEKNKKNNVTHFGTIEEYLHELEQAGFTNIKYQDATEYAEVAAKKEYEDFLSSKEKLSLLKNYDEKFYDEYLPMMEFFYSLFRDRDNSGVHYTFFYGDK